MIKIKVLKKDLSECVDRLNDLLKQLSARIAPLTEKEFSKFAKNNDFYIFGAFDGNELVGIASIAFFTTLSGLRAEIHDVVVDEKHRGRGISTLLVQKLLDTARDFVKKNNKKLKVSLTSKSRRKAANRLYVKLGFKLLASAINGGTNYYRLEIEP